MKISRKCARIASSLAPSPLSPTDGETIIRSRAPILALTTALSCALTACLLLFHGAWLWGAALAAISAGMGFWHTQIVFYSPILIVRDSIVTLYQEGEDVSIFMLSDLTVVQGNLTTGIVSLASALTGMALGAIGLSHDLEAALSLSLSPTQRLFLIMSGLWFFGNAISIAYLDFPRRRLLLRVASKPRRTIYIESRRQREELLLFLRTRQLEVVMLRVGLDPFAVVPGPRDKDSAPHHGNGAHE
jgi:hypothetical protein